MCFYFNEIPMNQWTGVPVGNGTSLRNAWRIRQFQRFAAIRSFHRKQRTKFLKNVSSMKPSFVAAFLFFPMPMRVNNHQEENDEAPDNQ